MSRVSETELPVARRARNRPGLFSYLLHHPFQLSATVTFMCVHWGRVRTHVWTCMHGYSGAHKTQRLIFNVFLDLPVSYFFLRQSPFKLEAHWLASLSGQQAPGTLLPPTTSLQMLGLQVHTATPGFVHRMWGFKLRSVRLCSKLLLHWVVSPALYSNSYSGERRNTSVWSREISGFIYFGEQRFL